VATGLPVRADADTHGVTTPAAVAKTSTVQPTTEDLHSDTVGANLFVI
jgi:hypothetical protein